MAAKLFGTLFSVARTPGFIALPVQKLPFIDEGIVSAIDVAARRRGVTRSAMVEILAREYLFEMV